MRNCWRETWCQQKKKRRERVASPPAMVQAGQTYFFFFVLVAFFFVANILTSLRQLQIRRPRYTASVSDSDTASKVLGPTFLKRLSRLRDVATEVSGVFPLI